MSSQPLMFFLAFLAVLALIGAAAWLVRRFAGNRLGTNASRGRMPRLAVIDAAAVDGRRRLVLVRRDNVEHLLMIGGPSDIVIEPNIVRATPSRDQLPTRAGVEPRLTAPELGQWEADTAAELPEPELPPIPTRPLRPGAAEEPRRAPPPMPERRPADPFASLVPEPIARPEPPMPRVEAPIMRAEPPIMRADPPILRPEPPITRPEPPVLRPEPPVLRPEPPVLRPEPPRPEPRMEPAPRPRAEPAMPRPPRPEPKSAPIRTERPAPPPAPLAPPPTPAAPVTAALATADQNLAEMANRLEAALRRPPNAPAEPAPPVAPEPPARPNPPTPRASEPAPEEPAAAEASPAAGKTGFESLEDEMAALLGRPKSPT